MMNYWNYHDVLKKNANDLTEKPSKELRLVDFIENFISWKSFCCGLMK